MPTATATEKPKQDVVDAEIQRKNDRERALRRDYVHAAVHEWYRRNRKPGDMTERSFRPADIEPIVPATHRTAVLDLLGQAHQQFWLASTIDPVTRANIDDAFVATSTGHQVFQTAHAKVGASLVADGDRKDAKPASTA